MLDKKELLSFIKENKNVSIHSICERFDISDSTARRALTDLEEKNKIVRFHGGAYCVDEQEPVTELEARRYIEADIKRGIAKSAASIIPAGATIIMLGGTTVKEMCNYIKDIPLTVVTNSIPVLLSLRSHKNKEIFLLGGLFNVQEEETGGVLTNIGIKRMQADYLFMGTTFFNEKHGFITRDQSAVELYMYCIERSNNVCVLVSSSKYQYSGSIVAARLEQVNYLFSDTGLAESAVRSISEGGVKVILSDRID